MSFFDNVKNQLKNLSLDKREDIVAYLEIRDLLLNKGFINSYDKKTQEIYWELFSENKYFDENLKVLKNLQSKKIEERIRSSNFIVEECVYKAYSNLVKFWVIDPRTICIVTEALNNETEEKVYVNLVRFLGTNALKYGYNDLGVFQTIVNNYDNLSNYVKIVVASQIFHFPTEKKWSFISSALKIDLNKSICSNFTSSIGTYLYEKKEFPELIRNEILSRYLKIITQAKSVKVANESADVILGLITKKEVDILEKSLSSRKVSEYSRSLIQNKIYEYKNV